MVNGKSLKERPIPKQSGYNAYLFFKKLIKILREKPASRLALEEQMDMEKGGLWHSMRVLTKHEVIIIDHYDMSHSSKRAVYRLIKDE